jgi:hypothetical protein
MKKDTLLEDRNQLAALVFLSWAFSIVYIPFVRANLTDALSNYILYSSIFLQLGICGYSVIVFWRLWNAYRYGNKTQRRIYLLRGFLYVYVLAMFGVSVFLTAQLLFINL